MAFWPLFALHREQKIYPLQSAVANFISRHCEPNLRMLSASSTDDVIGPSVLNSNKFVFDTSHPSRIASKIVFPNGLLQKFQSFESSVPYCQDDSVCSGDIAHILLSTNERSISTTV